MKIKGNNVSAYADIIEIIDEKLLGDGGKLIDAKVIRFSDYGCGCCSDSLRFYIDDLSVEELSTAKMIISKKVDELDEIIELLNQNIDKKVYKYLESIKRDDNEL